MIAKILALIGSDLVRVALEALSRWLMERQVVVEETAQPAVVVRQPRTSVVASGRATMDGIEARARARAGLPALAVLALLLAPLAGCTSTETLRREVEVRPVVLDSGDAVEEAAKVATKPGEKTPVVIFGVDGQPVGGGAAVELDISGSVVVPPWRWLELIRTESALVEAMKHIPPDAEAKVLEVLGRR